MADSERKEPSCLRVLVNLLLVLLILAIVAGTLCGPILPGGIKYGTETIAFQQARTIALCMYAYSNDNHGAYPDGKSSTEAFQKLLDGSYVTDPGIFYLPLLGKIKADAGQKLKPENVCFDITGGTDNSAPDGLPIVFMTGYKVDYKPGGSAVSLIKPYPPFWTRTWYGWWRGESSSPRSYAPARHGIAVAYASNSSHFKLPKSADDSDTSIPNLIPADIDFHGKTYRQLTPDGPLP